MMNIHQREYSARDVVAATGLPHATLQAWLNRGKIIGHRENPIEGGGSSGVHRRFSFHNIMEIGTAKALLDAGLGSVDDAFKAASSFAHVGSGPLSGLYPRREPSFPFDNSNSNGTTLLCVAGGKSRAIYWKPGTDILAEVFLGFDHGAGVLIMPVQPVFDRIVSALGFHPQAVMDEEYRKN